MAKRSAGVLFFKRDGNALEVLLVLAGGPFWKNKGAAAFMLPSQRPLLDWLVDRLATAKALGA
ncbi:hypothetical protein M527_04510 [Sphingobium indicum IP26]|uniref:Uncharacterized protein n=1 Tax=Sphingobium indicum F2 TaxID=1450518 RepID=A0A8E1C498_9SPHN|nr:hypothetical protein [Sphingobium indicum]EPR10979.1 hypothetical protein M527_02625 [Sphingobium indicum IP26]EPR11349.1 hypothetical protein M527_04510 [Sphingobium indicum IP26]KER38122.1 hypothetical protein AL00_01980 [Sphingobium indicum F2]